MKWCYRMQLCFFITKKKDSKAYEILLDGITINPYSVRLYKAYSIQSLWYGIPSFAEEGLKKLQSLLSKTQYDLFLREFDMEIVAFTKSLEN